MPGGHGFRPSILSMSRNTQLVAVPAPMMTSASVYPSMCLSSSFLGRRPHLDPLIQEPGEDLVDRLDAPLDAKAEGVETLLDAGAKRGVGDAHTVLPQVLCGLIERHCLNHALSSLLPSLRFS